ncbi:MAG: hypothetical protein AAFX08_08985 [Pseudomonadota bacterium]
MTNRERNDGGGDGAGEPVRGLSETDLSRLLDAAHAPKASESLQARLMSDFDRSSRVSFGGDRNTFRLRMVRDFFSTMPDISFVGASPLARFVRGGVLAALGGLGFFAGAVSANEGAEEEMAIAYFESVLDVGFGGGVEDLWDAQ